MSGSMLAFLWASGVAFERSIEIAPVSTEPCENPDTSYYKGWLKFTPGDLPSAVSLVSLGSDMLTFRLLALSSLTLRFFASINMGDFRLETFSMFSCWLVSWLVLMLYWTLCFLGDRALRIFGPNPPVVLADIFERILALRTAGSTDLLARWRGLTYGGYLAFLPGESLLLRVDRGNIIWSVAAVMIYSTSNVVPSPKLCMEPGFRRYLVLLATIARDILESSWRKSRCSFVFLT